MTGIYKIQSKIKSERYYIGSAINIHLRKIKHLNDLKNKKHANKKLQNHYNKYGEDDLEFSILISCSKENLIKHEQFFIDAYKPWFNICPNAGSALGRKWSESMREKMTGHIAWNKNKPLSETHKQKISDALKGIKYSPRSLEHKQNLSNSLKGKPSPNKGKKMSEKTKLKISQAKKGKKISEETKLKMSKSQKNIKHKKWSNESKVKFSEYMKGKKRALGHKVSDKSRERIKNLNLGKPAWNRGIPCSEESKIKQIETKKMKKYGIAI